ncbi:superoxide dismutase [Candidatus Gracilibacteria bacterium]|nr:superoxide dismutase [Candidatus Gracilibacteria bacterium]
MAYNAKPLPFTLRRIGNISEKALEIHHDKLYQGYVNKKNEIEEKLKTVDRATGNNVTYSDFRSLKLEETFAANGVYLHEDYFSVLGGEGQTALDATELSEAITAEFGSVDAWVADFKACGMSARGWAVLAYDTNDGRLHNYIGDMHNQGGVWGAVPVIVLDIYEHAYFIDYGSDRKTYIEDFMKNLDWKMANEVYVKVRNLSF